MTMVMEINSYKKVKQILLHVRSIPVTT